MKKVHQLEDLDHVRLLADPFKLRLLLAFAERPRTAKQVAAELGERVTRLYRHVDALHEAGLLEIVAEQRKRGTVERTFRAIAARFEVDDALFADRSPDGAAASMRKVLRAAEGELLEALARGGEPAPVAIRLQINVSPARLTKLREQLMAWIADVEAEPDDDAEATETVGGLITLYRLGD